MVMTWLWCKRRSRIAVATTGSPNALPHSPDRAVAGDQQRAALVAPRHQLEEQMRGVGLERQIAELVDNQQLGFGEEAETLLEPAFRMRLGECRHQRRRGHEQHRVAFANGGAAEG